jgi:hypothetical protein
VTFRYLTFTAIGTLLLASSLGAQRSPSTMYENGRRIALEGAITRIEWVTPRAFLFLDVKSAAGAVTNWAIDIGNPLDLQSAGWSRGSVRIGDIASVDGVPARGGAHQALASAVMLKPTGKRVFTNTARRAAAAAAPAPRRTDGHARLGAAPGKTGYWGNPSTTVLVERNAKVPMSADGVLVNVSDADRVAPFQPWAKAVYLYRQRTLLKDDPAARCLPAGGPRQFQMPNGFQFVEQPELGRILLMLGGGDRNWRVINTDGRPVGQAAEVVPAYYGTSVGHWDGNDTLVVDTVGFNERFWMGVGGLPHTEALHLTERFTRTDMNALKYDVTIDDPRTYTRPWSAGWTLQWIADKEMQEYFCEDNAESTFIK